MALIKCPECGNEMSDTLKKCPHCGYKVKKTSKNIIAISMVIVLLICAVGFFFYSQKTAYQKCMLGFRWGMSSAEAERQLNKIQTKPLGVFSEIEEKYGLWSIDYEIGDKGLNSFTIEFGRVVVGEHISSFLVTLELVDTLIDVLGQPDSTGGILDEYVWYFGDVKITVYDWCDLHALFRIENTAL